MLLVLVLCFCVSSLLAMKDGANILLLQDTPSQLPLLNVASLPLDLLQQNNAGSTSVQILNPLLQLKEKLKNQRTTQICPNTEILQKLVNLLVNLLPQYNTGLLEPKTLQNALWVLKNLLQRSSRIQTDRRLNDNELNILNDKLDEIYLKIKGDEWRMNVENLLNPIHQNAQSSVKTLECQNLLKIIVDIINNAYSQVVTYCNTSGKCDTGNIAYLNNDMSSQIGNSNLGLINQRPLYNNHRLSELQNLLLLKNLKPDLSLNKVNPQMQNPYLTKQIPESSSWSLQDLLLLNKNSKPDLSLNKVNPEIQNPYLMKQIPESSSWSLQDLLLLNKNSKPDLSLNKVNPEIPESSSWSLQDLLLLNKNSKQDLSLNKVNPEIQNPYLMKQIPESNSMSLQEQILLNSNSKPGLNEMNLQLQNPNLIGKLPQLNDLAYQQVLSLKNNIKPDLSLNVNYPSQESYVVNKLPQLNNLSWQQLLSQQTDTGNQKQNDIHTKVLENSLNNNNINLQSLQQKNLNDLLSIKNSPGANINANILGSLRNGSVRSGSELQQQSNLPILNNPNLLLTLGASNITENYNILNSAAELSKLNGNQQLVNYNELLPINAHQGQWKQLSYLSSTNLNSNRPNVQMNQLYDRYPIVDNTNTLQPSLNNYIQNNIAGVQDMSYQNNLNSFTTKIDLIKQSAYLNNNILSPNNDPQILRPQLNQNTNFLGLNQGVQESIYPSILTSPNSYVNPSLINTLVPRNEKHESYGTQLLTNSPQWHTVSNLDKSNLVQSNNKIIELTYVLKRQNINDQPLYYVKYKIPYNEFIYNMQNLITQKPYMRNQANKLYSELLRTSNVVEISENLKDMKREELVRLTNINGTLVDAKVLENNVAIADKHLKVLRELNAKLSQNNLSGLNDSNYKSIKLMEKLLRATASPISGLSSKSVVSQISSSQVQPSAIPLSGMNVNSLYNSNTLLNPSLNYNSNSLSNPSLNYNSNSLLNPSLNYNSNTILNPSLNYNSNSLLNPSLNYNSNSLSNPSVNLNSNGLLNPSLSYNYNAKTLNPASYYRILFDYSSLPKQNVGYVSSTYSKKLVG
ncbi:unnamed protein product [Euphydryas editha]|uniref:Uncharacterized protein n=1 Tax=Euphydryas editha TaxID=104508 RepID=A0AAU9UIV0_EUPED|nr:unnamed protein product [Euphydryas editha]